MAKGYLMFIYNKYLKSIKDGSLEKHIMLIFGFILLFWMSTMFKKAHYFSQHLYAL